MTKSIVGVGDIINCKNLYVLVDFGIVGLILFLMLLKYMYLQIKYLKIRNKKAFSSQILFVFFIIWVVLFFNVGIYQNSREMWLFFSLMLGSKKIY